MHQLSLQFLKISLQIANCREEPRGDRFASDCILSHAVRSAAAEISLRPRAPDSLPEVRSWYALLYDHRTRPARRKCSPRHRAHHHRVASAELATRLLVDCQLEGTERCAAHRHCRKG